MEKIHLKDNIKSRVLNGHPWIYKNELDINSFDKSELNNGDIVKVYYKNRFLGNGYFNKNSQITIRLLTREDVKIDKQFFKTKIENALNFRKNFLINRLSTNKNKQYDLKNKSFRVIFSEADGIPGLIVDKFDKFLSIQISTYGIYNYKNEIIDALIEIFSPAGIFEKDDENFAKIEGFKPVEGWVYKNGPELIPFELNGIKFFADTKGQKTGFFLDQRLNALEISKYADTKTCLDAFSYTGNFGIHLLYRGAKHVTFIDYSKRAIFVLEETLKTNNIDKSKFTIINGNSFKILKKFETEKRKFDIVVIDPPSMTKTKNNLQNAKKGYKTLNKLAIALLDDSGILSTSSCTQHLYEEDFLKIIYESALKNNKILKLLYKGSQPADHPVILNILETYYLKNFIFTINKI